MEAFLVENLTLSKMTVRAKGMTKEQWDELPLRFEAGITKPAQVISIRASYELNGRPIESESRVLFRHAGQFCCTICNRSVKKLFDGCCYPCLQSSAQADRCVLNPVGCHYTKGTCREPSWGEEFCYQPHYVYLAFTDKFKVGITRSQQVPTRWIDQGATMAVLLAKVGSRHQAGVLEAFLCRTFADKSHWMKMLKSANNRPSLEEFNSVRSQALAMLAAGLADGQSESLRVAPPDAAPQAAEVAVLNEAVVAEIEFPFWNAVPEKVVSLSLDKTPALDSPVYAIKGQYLFLRDGVLNVRRHEGYVVNCAVGNANGPDCGV
jgi:hypothetical protein